MTIPTLALLTIMPGLRLWCSYKWRKKRHQGLGCCCLLNKFRSKNLATLSLYCTRHYRCDGCSLMREWYRWLLYHWFEGRGQMLARANPLFVPVIVSFVSIYTQCLQMELGLALLPDTYRSNTDF
jgi:hypothetical protein